MFPDYSPNQIYTLITSKIKAFVYINVCTVYVCIYVLFCVYLLCINTHSVYILKIFTCTWVKGEKGFTHKNNSFNTALNCCLFPNILKSLIFLIKHLIANFDIFFCAKNKYHTIYDLLKNELPSPQILIFF